MLDITKKTAMRVVWPLLLIMFVVALYVTCLFVLRAGIRDTAKSLRYAYHQYVMLQSSDVVQMRDEPVYLDGRVRFFVSENTNILDLSKFPAVMLLSEKAWEPGGVMLANGEIIAGYNIHRKLSALLIDPSYYIEVDKEVHVYSDIDYQVVDYKGLLEWIARGNGVTR